MTPTNIQTLAERKIAEVIAKRTFKFEGWEGKQFSCFKFASATEKGDMGEDFLSEMLVALGYKNVEVVKGRRGHYDVRVKNLRKDVKFEVKTATLDTHGNFQFNGIRYDTQYTHLFFFGVLPEEIRYEIVPKSKIGSTNYKMMPMQKSTNATFKITRPSAKLEKFGTFRTAIVKLLGESR